MSEIPPTAGVPICADKRVGDATPKTLPCPAQYPAPVSFDKRAQFCAGVIRAIFSCVGWLTQENPLVHQALLRGELRSFTTLARHV